MNMLYGVTNPGYVYGHRYLTTVIPSNDVLLEAVNVIRHAPEENFDELINPFERKKVWRDKFNLPYQLEAIIQEMEFSFLQASRLFNVPTLEPDRLRHYAGVFRYPKEGYLSAHVDAGIHPINKQRKHITMLLYLGGNGKSGGELELWQGDSAGEDDPQLHELIATITPVHGMIVVFENNDRAWHAAGPHTGDEDRLVLTVSFLSDQVDAFRNKRERAFFAPRPGEEWSEEAKELRRLRSNSDTAHEVYRVGT